MFNFIKNNLIQFDKLIITEYYKLNIDEVDTIILIRLHDLLTRGVMVLNDDDIASSMKISKNELGNRIVNLVNNGFITLELSSVDAKEVFNLDETYRRLAFILEGKNLKVNKDILNNQIKDTTNLLEKELKKILSPLEREMIQKWYVDDNYSSEEIEEAIFNTLKYKNRGITYIDRLLQAKRRDQEVKETKAQPANENIKDLFNKIYAKSK